MTKSVVPRRSLVGVFNAFFQPSAAAVIDERLNLVALLRELERLNVNLPEGLSLPTMPTDDLTQPPREE